MELLNLIICACGSRCLPFRTDSFWCHPVVNASLIWAIAVFLLGIMFLIFHCGKNKLKKEMADAEHQHELALKEKNFKHEMHWHEEGLKAKVFELKRSIEEFESLTIRQKILDKVIKTETDKEVENLKKAFEDLKKQYESLSGEIESIIIKKK